MNVFCEIQDGDADEDEGSANGPVNNVKRREFVPLVKDAS